MLMHAMAPSKVAAPVLYAKLTWVKELGLTWSELGGIDHLELGLLAELVNIKNEAERIKSKVANKGLV